MIKLINSMETDRMKCLKGEISAKRLYRDVSDRLNRFKVKHPGFDYLKDPALKTYFS